MTGNATEVPSARKGISPIDLLVSFCLVNAREGGRVRSRVTQRLSSYEVEFVGLRQITFHIRL